MSNGWRLILAALLGVLLAGGYLLVVDRQARLRGEAPAAAPPASAPRAAGSGQLHKCVDAAGAASIQSQPCPPDSRTLWTRAVTPEPGSDPPTEITMPAPGDTAAAADAPAPVSFACQMARGDLASYRAGESGPVDDAEVELREQTVEEACR